MFKPKDLPRTKRWAVIGVSEACTCTTVACILTTERFGHAGNVTWMHEKVIKFSCIYNANLKPQHRKQRLMENLPIGKK